jgi:hypothetical protein
MEHGWNADLLGNGRAIRYKSACAHAARFGPDSYRDSTIPVAKHHYIPNDYIKEQIQNG